MDTPVDENANRVEPNFNTGRPVEKHRLSCLSTAESVAEAVNEIYREQGYETGYRTGRSIGMAYLESPELREGDKTILQPGMTFAVDGGVSVDGRLSGRIGDSIVVTTTGSEYLTNYPREILVTHG